MLRERHHVRERLTGVLRVRQGVDDRDHGRVGELLQQGWSNTRATIASAKRSSVRATSRGASREPRPTSSPTSTTDVPPSRAMPTSTLTRVRSEGFWNTSATARPARGRSPGSAGPVEGYDRP